jgi:hypothetical protein
MEDKILNAILGDLTAMNGALLLILYFGYREMQALRKSLTDTMSTLLGAVVSTDVAARIKPPQQKD